MKLLVLRSNSNAVGECNVNKPDCGVECVLSL